MNNTNFNEQTLLNLMITAIQSCISNYPTYNYLTQGQNYLRQQIVKECKNPLLRKGNKYYSQNEEDGILLEILNRMGLSTSPEDKTFIEFGVGNGLENNSLILLMLGWKGAWVGNEELAFNIPEHSKLIYTKDWISLDNIVDIYKKSAGKLGVDDYDLFSMDLDGNDLHFIESILNSGTRPKIIISEYNAKFPPPIEFSVKYDSNHTFVDDYMGASLQSLSNLVSRYGYKLVACNVTGSNCFFIRDDYAHCFHDVPDSIEEVFMPANYGIVTRIGHPAAAKTVLSFLI